MSYTMVTLRSASSVAEAITTIPFSIIQSGRLSAPSRLPEAPSSSVDLKTISKAIAQEIAAGIVKLTVESLSRVGSEARKDL